MKRFFCLVLTVFVILGFSDDAVSAEATWYSFNEGLTKAEKENKSILIDFYADWCHWCKVMDKNTFQNVQVAKKLQERFVPIRLDAEAGNESVKYKNQTLTNPQLTRYFGITGFPSLVFLNSKGEPITVVPGYSPPEQFINILNYIDLKCYEKKVSFEDFLKTGGCADQGKM